MSDYWPESDAQSDDPLPLFGLPQNPDQTAGFDSPSGGRESRAAEVLNALASGPKTTHDLLQVSSHRFAVDIQKLRESGYKIISSPAGKGCWLYELQGTTKMKRLKKGMQEAYYKCQHWKELSAKRREYDDYQCVMCHCESSLNVHHWDYSLFNESLHHIMTLCVDCHAWIHGRVKISFPKSVDEDIWERLNSLVGKEGQS